MVITDKVITDVVLHKNLPRNVKWFDGTQKILLEFRS